eukprot:325734-Amphidinium_carterae.1
MASNSMLSLRMPQLGLKLESSPRSLGEMSVLCRASESLHPSLLKEDCRAKTSRASKAVIPVNWDSISESWNPLQLVVACVVPFSVVLTGMYWKGLSVPIEALHG